MGLFDLLTRGYHIEESILYKILSILDKAYLDTKIFPDKLNVFKAFKLCTPQNLKVVMIGQDPYPQPGIATGILFGNPKGTIELSPSLELIKDRVYKDIYLPETYNNFDCTLENWAKQGILMINSSLTVEAYKPGSHAALWRPFMEDLLTKLSLYNSGIIYVLFGKQAESLAPLINHSSNYVFIYKHPAYFSRLGQELDCDAFIKINKILKQNHNLKIEF